MSDTLETLFSMPQFTLSTQERDALLIKGLKELTAQHEQRCAE